MIEKRRKTFLARLDTVEKSLFAIGSIAANWGFRPSNFPFPLGSGALSNAMLLVITTPNGISVCPTAVAGCTSVTHRQTDHERIHLSQ